MLVQRFQEEKLFFDDEWTRKAWTLRQQQPQWQLAPVPALNIRENTAGFWLELVVPGLTESDIAISIEDNWLYLRYAGRGNVFEPINQQRSWRQEYVLKPFTRQVPVDPAWVDVDRLEVSAQHGIVRVFLPKKNLLLGKVTQIMGFSLN